MFSDQSFYEAKVFLRSYGDAINCLKGAAEKEQSIRFYESFMKHIVEAKEANEIDFKYGRVSKGPQFKELKEYKLFQFSNHVFKKYLPDFDGYKGDYPSLTKFLREGIDKLKTDVTKVEGGSQ
eukprot:TRINITY_DN274_c0_g2_i1.p1 TRINITY_DN274_c0_g2~~TRINITY_DN274_c0_g2_i1.p1  ORF type:complete len:123 (+),score=44.01 TRINITY_DN274_c0_g2_i1:75-443(+)